jgi:hypothetical protein
LRARLTLRLKPGCLQAFTHTYNRDVVPVLTRQQGFCDGIVYADSSILDVTAIDVWESEADANDYVEGKYFDVLRFLEQVLDCEPSVRSSGDVISIFRNVNAHDLPARSAETPVQSGEIQKREISCS